MQAYGFESVPAVPRSNRMKRLTHNVTLLLRSVKLYLRALHERRTCHHSENRGRQSVTGVKDSGIAKWDPGFTERVIGILRPVAKRYFRSEVRGLGQISTGGALVVSNHSGATLATDLPTFAAPVEPSMMEVCQKCYAG